jgi:hypothetical protein
LAITERLAFVLAVAALLAVGVAVREFVSARTPDHRVQIVRISEIVPPAAPWQPVFVSTTAGRFVVSEDVQGAGIDALDDVRFQLEVGARYEIETDGSRAEGLFARCSPAIVHYRKIPSGVVASADVSAP